MMSSIPNNAHRRRGVTLSVLAILTGLVLAGSPLTQPSPAAAATPTSLLPDHAVPKIQAVRRHAPTELGMRFRTSARARAIGVQFYKGRGNTGRHRATLWTRTGKRLARVRFKHETARGLQAARFSHPVKLKAHTTYVVSYTAPHGRYAADKAYFQRPRHKGVLSAGRNAGVYSRKPGHFPTRTSRGTSYAVDIMIRRQARTSRSCASATPNAPDGPSTRGRCWAGPSTTGVPADVALKRVPQDVTTSAQAGRGNSGWRWDGSAGGIRITAAGAKISGVDVSGGILPHATKPRMSVVDTRFRCTNVDNGDFCGALGANSTMTRSEIGGGADGRTYINSQGFWVGGSSAHNVITRVEIHHIVHGLHIDGGTTLADSYIHDMPAGDPAGNDGGNGHSDGVFVSTGGNMVFRHVTFDQAANNCSLFVQDYDGTAEGIFNLSVTDNLFISTHRNGQASSYGVGIENKSIKGAGTLHVRDNVFSRGWEVAPIEVPRGADVAGNTYRDGHRADIVWAR